MEMIELKTIIRLREHEIDKISKICKDVQLKDPTFIWEIVQDPEDRYALVLTSKDLKNAHSRGGWIKKIIREHFHRKSKYMTKEDDWL